MGNINKEQLAVMIGRRLKELRTAQTDVGQSEIAKELGLKKQTISGYENGRFIPDITVLIAFAERYSCSVDYFLGLDDNPCKKQANYSENPSIEDLLDSLSRITDDDQDFLASSFADMVRELAILDGHPKRKELIECIGELITVLTEYIGKTKSVSKRLSDQSEDNSLTAENVAVEWARFNDFERMAKSTIDDIARMGLETLISFSTSAKKALRIRTGWKPKKMKGVIYHGKETRAK